MKKLALLGTLLLAGLASAAVPKDTLVIMSAVDIPTLDPGTTYDTSSQSLVDQMYETLLTYKGASIKEFAPLLATKWTISNGGKSYTFDLRKNVKFHSGNTMSCQDAEYSFQRNLVINGGESGNWFIAESLLGTQSNANDDKTITWARIDKSVECTAAGQLVFSLPKVDPAFLAKLAYSGQSILERKYNASIGEWDGTEATWKDWVGKDLTGSNLSKKPNGTGPYKLVSQDANSHLFQAFDGYWGGKVALQKVIRQKVPELAAQEQAFLKGDADIIDTNGRARAADETQIKGKPGVTWEDDLSNLIAGGIFMNQKIKGTGLLGSGKLDGKGITDDFFSDVNVRKAFGYAFNYQQYINDVHKGKGQQLTMLLPPSFPGYDARAPKYSYDAKKAEDFFKKAWGGKLWEQGFILTANYRAGSVLAQTAMEILKKNVEAINPKFRVNIQPKQWSEMLAASKKGEEAMMIFNWLPDYADPDNFMYTFYHSEGFYSPRSNFKDAQIDGWLTKARETVNMPVRSKYYSQVARRAYDLAPFVNLPAPTAYNFYRSELKGWVFNPMTPGFPHWKDLSKK